jgi:type I restriction enzyme M protein
MPSGVFQPYSGVGTAVLVFVKGGKTENVWFYEMREDGYSLDQKREFMDGKGDIPDIIDKFEKREQSNQSISVPFVTIKQNDFNLSIARYKPIEREEIAHEDPNHLLDNLLEAEQEIASELTALKEMMK